MCDADGKPVAFVVTPGQASDLEGADKLLPVIEANTVVADKGYDADQRVRHVLAAAGKKAVIPPRRKRNNPAAYDKQLYKERHHIENFFAKLKDFRAIATRYDKLERNFLSGIYLAATLIWMTN